MVADSDIMAVGDIPTLFLFLLYVLFIILMNAL